MLLPTCLDDYIAEDNPERAVDAFVEELDLRALGSAGADPAVTGRPAYHPAVLIKLYICGYLNRIPSSRRLEREAQRNVGLMWLTGRLAPDCKTIADFRRANGDGIRAVCRRFVQLCRELKLFAQAIVAIDSSKFKAVNSRDRNFTPNKVERRQQQIEQWLRQRQVFDRLLYTLRQLRRPIIAAVHGMAYGGGCEIAISTDFIIASDDALFGQPEAMVGLSVGGGGPVFLPRVLPPGIAMQMLMTGEPISAQQAHRLSMARNVGQACPRASVSTQLRCVADGRLVAGATRTASILSAVIRAGWWPNGWVSRLRIHDPDPQ